MILLAALAPFTDLSVPTADEGSYGLQADALEEGRWVDDWPFVDLGQVAQRYPIANATISEAGPVPYVKHPLFSMVQAGAGRLLGRDLGYVLPSLAGVVGAAAAAWAVARRTRPGAEAIAFWLTATGPVLFNGFVIWAHAPGAALGGLAVLGAVRRRSDPPGFRVLDQLMVAFGLGGLLLVRSEGLLFAMALLGAMAFDHVVRGAGRFGARPEGLSWSSRLLGTVQVVVPGLVALVAARLAERAWIASIVGAAPADLTVRSLDGDPGWLAGRLTGVWWSTFAGSLFGARAVILPILVLLVGLVVVARGRLRGSDPIPLLLVVVAVVMVVQLVAADVDRITGLLAAWPLVVVGLAGLGRKGWTREPLLVATVGLFTAAVWATQYADGGAFQWGGRLLQAATVPLAVLAAVGLRGLLDERQGQGQGQGRRGLAVAMAVLALAGAGASMVSLGALRHQTGVALDGIAAAAGPVAIAPNVELPRLMWRYDIEWLHADRSELGSLLEDLRRSTSLREVSIVSSEPFDDGDVVAFGKVISRQRAALSGLYVIRVTRA